MSSTGGGARFGLECRPPEDDIKAPSSHLPVAEVNGKSFITEAADPLFGQKRQTRLGDAIRTGYEAGQGKVRMSSREWVLWVWTGPMLGTY